MCLASMEPLSLSIEDAPYVSAGLRDAASLCTPSQAALATRLHVAADMIDKLFAGYTLADFAARTNKATIVESRR